MLIYASHTATTLLLKDLAEVFLGCSWIIIRAKIESRICLDWALWHMDWSGWLKDVELCTLPDWTGISPRLVVVMFVAKRMRSAVNLRTIFDRVATKVFCRFTNRVFCVNSRHVFIAPCIHTRKLCVEFLRRESFLFIQLADHTLDHSKADFFLKLLFHRLYCLLHQVDLRLMKGDPIVKFLWTAFKTTTVVVWQNCSSTRYCNFGIQLRNFGAK